MTKYTKKILIDILQNYYKEKGVLPTSTSTSTSIEKLKICHHTFSDFFGSWNNALLEAGFPIKYVPPVEVTCLHCGKSFKKRVNQVNRTPNNFCSRSCAAIYNNAHKTTGNKRSKLEIWLEKQLTNTYPHVSILYCNKETINSELDIFIPSISVAFELNGIFHYEPIYGVKKLEQTKTNDNKKSTECLKKNISLYVIDTSKQKHFTEKSSQHFLTFVITTIEKHKRMCSPTG